MPQTLIDQYYESDYINQSELKSAINGYHSFYNYKNRENKKEDALYFQEDKEHFLIGSAVDCLITQGIEVFVEQYYVSSLEEKPSEKIMSIVRFVFDQFITDAVNTGYDEAHILNSSFADNAELIIAAARIEKWNSTWGNDAIVKNVVLQGEAYWEEIKHSRGKKILSQSQHKKAMDIYESIINEFPEFFSENTFNNPNILVIFQLPVYTQLEGYNVKILIDMAILIYREDDEPLIALFDFKTTAEEVMNFHKSYSKFGYDFQGAVYHYVFIHAFKEREIFPYLRDNYPFESDSERADFNNLSNHIRRCFLTKEENDIDTKVRFYFIVENSNHPLIPLLLQVPQIELESTFEGRPMRQYETFLNNGAEFYLETLPEKVGVLALLERVTQYRTIIHDNVRDFRGALLPHDNTLFLLKSGIVPNARVQHYNDYLNQIDSDFLPIIHHITNSNIDNGGEENEYEELDSFSNDFDGDNEAETLTTLDLPA